MILFCFNVVVLWLLLGFNWSLGYYGCGQGGGVGVLFWVLGFLSVVLRGR